MASDTDFDLGSLEDEATKNIKEGKSKNLPSVGVEKDQSFVKIDTGLFLRILKPFMQKKTMSRDAVSRSVLINSVEGGIEIFATDKISYLSATIKAENNNFPATCVLDLETIFKIAKASTKTFYILYREGRFSASFYGGSIFIPSYRIEPDEFINRFETKDAEEMDPSVVHAGINSLDSLLSSSDIPELSYIFSCGDGLFASNGIVTAQSFGRFPVFSIRQKDVSLVKLIMEVSQKDKVTFCESEEFYVLRTPLFNFHFPKARVKLDKRYSGSFKDIETKYIADPTMFYQIVDLLASMPESSGNLDLVFNHTLTIQTKTKKGDVSEFDLPVSLEGPALNTTIKTSLKTVGTALRVFQKDSTVYMGVEGKILQLGSDLKRATVVLGG